MNYFYQFGEVKQANVMKYTDRQVSRGFGFCIFENSCSAELAMKTKNHIIDGREVLPIAELLRSRWMFVGHFLKKWPLLHSLPVRFYSSLLTLAEQSPKNCVRKLFIGRLSLDVTERTLSAF